MQTVMASKLAEKGFIAREVKFNIALSEFQNNGGSFERAMSLVMTAYGKGSEGQGMPASKGQFFGATASRTHDDGKGQTGCAGKANFVVPSPSSPERNRAGHSAFAAKAQGPVPSPVSPVYLAAAKKGAKAIALTVLDSFKVRDGRSIGNLTFGELESIRVDNAMEASVIRQIQRHAGNATANQLVRDVIKSADLERFVQRGAEVADAA